VSDRYIPLVTGVNGTPMARRTGRADLSCSRSQAGARHRGLRDYEFLGFWDLAGGGVSGRPQSSAGQIGHLAGIATI
jgi:hypothetical protein